ncbi:MAG: hypothetical protein ACLTN1_04615 [Acutalibacteraceae bacterium]|jgi:hypothetical protein|uniref:Uncharacterized protein n=1 Tax=Siphoviridae sp. ctwuP1 TaxID=2827972 RepID=A0A8S5TBH0_9CAUD|nr:MAG TPA: hypothetical protein [Siphoviridae sp. ctwuP1]
MKAMEVSINAETAAKIKALERIGPLFRDATPERKGYLLAYMDITRQLISGDDPQKSA